MNENSKTVLITGCSAGGAGSSLALAFASKGLHVFATARDLSKMSHLNENPNITLIHLDVTSSSSIASAVKTVTIATQGTRDNNQSGKLDYLVNNAAVSFTMPILDTNIEFARKMFDTNVWGFLAVTQAFAPLLIAAKGHIANVCSVAGYCNSPWMGSYGASKAAMLVLSETLRLELAPFGVSVNSIVAGSIDTQIMVKGAGSDWKLPAESLYHAAEESIRDRATGGRVPSKMSPDEFAKRVVGDVLGGVQGITWRGAMATAVRAIMHLPVALMVRLKSCGFSLGFAGVAYVLTTPEQDMALKKDVGLENVVPSAAKS